MNDNEFVFEQDIPLIDTTPAIQNGSARSAASLSVVVPAYNEAGNIRAFLDRLLPCLERTRAACEIIFVDDGSADKTPVCVAEQCALDARIKLIRLSRNFGKEAALNAGLSHAIGDLVIQIDVDLQHPPETIDAMIKEWSLGADIVYAKRNSRQDESWMRRFLARSFYRVFGLICDVKLMEGAGDFILLDRKVVDALMQLPERGRFTKGLYAWVGFRRKAVPFDVAPRAHGQSGWPLLKLARFAMDAMTAFGSLPLKVWTYIGLLLAFASTLYGAVIFVQKLAFGIDVPGYASLMVAVCFLSGVQLLGLGIMGEYVSRIFAEVKQRPMFLVQERIGFDQRPYMPQTSLQMPPSVVAPSKAPSRGLDTFVS
ncbi:glycosyltransferase family 2 protein [Roseovarius mucosus]|uniref:glycosyltransferase family 2 protein n=1 Tax=Roseovarius mucosus TaxID=215743 RepID=UPI001C5F0F2C|nr:glycosyltransferase family 2 protein [Roseovarius mucosus]MBW4975599.1 glycosyltransferase family 2 protein [Roseovarius mucosus]